MPETARRDALVIGAGLAGLSAAHVLEAAGLDVLVLEAQQRIGGRIHSMRQIGGTGEAGATYIGAGYARVMAAARRYGIELVDVTSILEFFREQDLVLGGELIRQADWERHPANPFPPADKRYLPWNYHRVLTMRDNPLPEPSAWLAPSYRSLDVSAHDWLKSLGLSERAIDVAYGLNVSFGRDSHDVSALLLLFRGAFSKQQRASAPRDGIGYTVKDGVQRIPEAMAGALRGGVERGCVVTAIEVERAAATVRIADGRRFTARHVIAAVPIAALRAIAIEPGLPPLQRAAVAELPAQPLTQVYLRPKSAFWHVDGYAPSLFTDTLAGMLAAGRSGSDPTEVTSLTAWITGDAASGLDRLAPADAGRKVIAAIESLRPAAVGQIEYVALQSWGADPFAGGAWAYFRPGQVTRFAAALGTAHGRLHFCGEHLAVDSRGMEGAMETGERAAAEALALE
jgi:monoamine oxidase